MSVPTHSRQSMIVRSDIEAGLFVAERVFDAPPERVFQAFTDCEHLRRWWGPAGWSLPFCELDFREGGRWHYGMRGPDGMESWGLATYLEIRPPSRLVYRDEFADADGNPQPDMPVMTNEVDFVDEGGRTRLVNTTRFGRPEDLRKVVEMGMEEGLAQTWDRLEDELRGPAGTEA